MVAPDPLLGTAASIPVCKVTDLYGKFRSYPIEMQALRHTIDRHKTTYVSADDHLQKFPDEYSPRSVRSVAGHIKAQEILNAREQKNYERDENRGRMLNTFIPGSRQDRDRRRRELEYGIQEIGDWVGGHGRRVESRRREKERRKEEEKRSRRRRREKVEVNYNVEDVSGSSGSSAETEPYDHWNLTRMSSESSAEITYPRGDENRPNTRYYEDELALQMADTTLQGQPRQTTTRLHTNTAIMAPPPPPAPAPVQAPAYQYQPQPRYRPDSAYAYLSSGSGSGPASASEWMSPTVRDRDTGVIFRPPPTPPETPEKPFPESSAVTWGIGGNLSRGQVGPDAAGEWSYSPASDWWRRR